MGWGVSRSDLSVLSCAVMAGWPGWLRSPEPRNPAGWDLCTSLLACRGSGSDDGRIVVTELGEKHASYAVWAHANACSRLADLAVSSG